MNIISPLVFFILEIEVFIIYMDLSNLTKSTKWAKPRPTRTLKNRIHPWAQLRYKFLYKSETTPNEICPNNKKNKKPKRRGKDRVEINEEDTICLCCCFP